MAPREFDPNANLPWETGAPPAQSWRDNPAVTVPAGLAGLYAVYRGGKYAYNRARGKGTPLRQTAPVRFLRNLNQPGGQTQMNTIMGQPARQFALVDDVMYEVQPKTYTSFSSTPKTTTRMVGRAMAPEGGLVEGVGSRFLPGNTSIMTRSAIPESFTPSPSWLKANKGGILGIAAGIGAGIVDDTDWMRNLTGRPTKKEAGGSDEVRAMIQSRAVSDDKSNSLLSDVWQSLSSVAGGDISAPDAAAAEKLYEEGYLKFKDRNLRDVGKRGGQFQYRKTFNDERGLEHPAGRDVEFMSAMGDKAFGAFELTDKGRAAMQMEGRPGSPDAEMAASLDISDQRLRRAAMNRGIDPSEIQAQFAQGVEGLVGEKKNGYLTKDGYLNPKKVGQLKKDTAELATVLEGQLISGYYAQREKDYLQAVLPGQILQAYGEFYAPYAEQYIVAGQANAAEDRLRASEYEPGSPLYDAFMANARASELKGMEGANRLMQGEAMAPFLGAATQSNQNLAKQIQRFVTQQASNSGGGEAVLGEEGAAQDMTQSLMETLGIMDMDIFQGMPSATGSGSLNDYVNFDLYGPYNTR